MSENNEPNYKVIELQAENENLKDKLIASLEENIKKLNEEIVYLKALISQALGSPNVEKHVGDNMIAPPNFKPRTVIRTLSEAGAILERKSLSLSQFPVSAEDLKNEEI